jgi:hypothetical protein
MMFFFMYNCDKIMYHDITVVIDIFIINLMYFLFLFTTAISVL